jgi:hypothetical protein
MWFAFFVPTIVAGEPRHLGRAAAAGSAPAIIRSRAAAAIAAARHVVVRLDANAPAKIFT